MNRAERIALPTQDTVCFGRGEQVDRTSANDVALGLPDALAARQVSRRHFELRAHPDGVLLKALTSQSIEVDGTTMRSVTRNCRSVPARASRWLT